MARWDRQDQQNISNTNFRSSCEMSLKVAMKSRTTNIFGSKVKEYDKKKTQVGKWLIKKYASNTIFPRSKSVSLNDKKYFMSRYSAKWLLIKMSFLNISYVHTSNTHVTNINEAQTRHQEPTSRGGQNSNFCRVKLRRFYLLHPNPLLTPKTFERRQ